VHVDMIRNAVEAGHKVLLFSQFTSMLAILTDRLSKEGLPIIFLKERRQRRMRADMVDAFQKDDTPVFCISLKAGGTGLNLPQRILSSTMIHGGTPLLRIRQVTVLTGSVRRMLSPYTV
jgi:hypothetical protein